MGCDIHAYVDCVRNGRVETIAEVYIDRNYDLFTALAGVRAYGDTSYDPPEPKGLPLDFDWRIDTAIRNQEAEGWPKPMDPDWHSHSWVTADELQVAVDRIKHRPSEGAIAALGMMRALDADGGQSRLVFWFDN